MTDRNPLAMSAADRNKLARIEAALDQAYGVDDRDAFRRALESDDYTLLLAKEEREHFGDVAAGVNHNHVQALIVLTSTLGAQLRLLSRRCQQAGMHGRHMDSQIIEGTSALGEKVRSLCGALDTVARRADEALSRPQEGVTDFEMSLEERTLTLTLICGERTIMKEAKVAGLLIDRGVYRAGATYDHGDVCTFGGSMWVSLKDGTKTKPPSDEWRLAVRRGQDGRR